MSELQGRFGNQAAICRGVSQWNSKTVGKRLKMQIMCCEMRVEEREI